MLYDLTVSQSKKMLANLAGWLEKTQGYADGKKFDAGVLLKSRLAPDQFDFTRQVQIACDHAKNGAARLAGVTPPAFDDNEQTLGELQARIQKTIAFLDTLQAADFTDAAARHISLPRWEGKYLPGGDYAQMYLLPNFYFHATTAYAILRHNGVPLGKNDYVGQLPFKS